MTLADRLRTALARPTGTMPMPLAGDDPVLFDGDAAVPTGAAVLVAVTDRTDPGVILTRRAETLRHHPGQVAFPGGRIDPGEDAVAAALREADEEIALPPTAVTVVGTLDRYRTGTGFDVTPVVGVIAPDQSLRASEAEVAAVFEVPLAFVLDPANHRPATATLLGQERRFVEIVWHQHRIWGATAAMIVNLARRLA